MLVNGLIMLIFPNRWFDLPPYLGFHGSLRRESLSSLTGRLSIRALGFVFAAVISWILWALLETVHGKNPGFASGLPELGSVPQLACYATCLWVAACAFLMLLKPAWWLQKYAPLAVVQNPRTPVLATALRVAAVPLLAIAGYFAVACAK